LFLLKTKFVGTLARGALLPISFRRQRSAEGLQKGGRPEDAGTAEDGRRQQMEKRKMEEGLKIMARKKIV